jgi:hypothetical protein
MDAILQYMLVLVAALICLTSSATIPQKDCVERSLVSVNQIH